MGDWRRTLVGKAFFVLAFVIVSTIGVAKMLGVDDSSILETIINAVVSTVVSMLLVLLVLGRSRGGGVARG